MCGINGIFQFNNKYNRDEVGVLISKMNDQIVHRGPDSEGIYCDEKCAIGMRRLSIIDLDGGNQPIWNTNKTKGIVFNGEIYNFKELRQELKCRGISFTTDSDTEIIVQGIEADGMSFVKKLEGMFAFAIYDKINQSIMLVRDRAGEKPIYYCMDNGVLYFASELKSLKAVGVSKNINRMALELYLHLSYIPSPYSIYENVHKVKSGYWMMFDSRGDVKEQRYWDVCFEPGKIIENYDECKKLLRRAVEESVEKCMYADVPVGTFLSGGIDSGIITGLMATKSSKPIKTFTLGFKEKEYDESKRAEIIVNKYKTEHHLKIVGYEDVFAAMPNIINSMDEPFADQSIIVTYILSEFTKKYVKAVLTGDGGDELFAGYSRYLIGYYSKKFNEMPTPLQKLTNNFFSRLEDQTRLSRKINNVLSNAALSLGEQRLNLMCLAFKNGSLKNIDSSLFDFIKDYYNKFSEKTDEINCTLYTDFKVSLEGDMLTKVDRASMLASLETRVPLLGKNVIEVASHIPGNYKMSGKQQKKVFKDAFKDIIPGELYSKTKRGFEVPISEWIRDELKEDVFNTITCGYLKDEGIVTEDSLRQMFREHENCIHNYSMELWSIYIFEKWYAKNM